MQTADSGKRYRLVNSLTGWGMALVALVTYLLTLEPAVSFWDCPEYVVTADRLEVGHPPGNALFSLTGRVFITLFGSIGGAAVAVNIMSALLSALTVALLFWSVTIIARRIVSPGKVPQKGTAWLIMGCGVIASLVFAWSDTFWFSAVEAEVYAYASFCTALVVWLMLRWYENPDAAAADRWIILIAYVMGLSINVHQLDMLCIPALAILFVYGRRRRVNFAAMLGALGVSLVIIAALLFGMMSGMMELGKMSELLAVNRFSMPYNSGLAVYGFLLFTSYAVALAMCRRRAGYTARIAGFIALSLSGFFYLGGSPLAFTLFGGVFLAVILLAKRIFTTRVVRTMLWCGLMVTLGASVYLVIPLRAWANPPVNTGSPSDIFAFESYIGREQYGEHPLIKGPTPESPRLMKEKYDSLLGIYSYDRCFTRRGKPQYVRVSTPHPQVRYFNGGVSPADSAENTAILGASVPHGYILRGYKTEFVNAPDMDAWFSRIFSNDPSDRVPYRNWAGMEDEDMAKVEVADAIDADGNIVGRINSSTGKREKRVLRKPTALQQLRYFVGYQVGYMYFRYLLWNFTGRQNDVHTQGQVDNGNFITGIDALDSAMLGPTHTVPPELGKDNPGHHEYYLLPFLFGIAGLIWMCMKGREGRRQTTFIAALFVMTGLAIVIYLNQTPGEPRERDYSFVGSFYAFAMWTGFAVFPVASLLRKVCLRRAAVPVVSTLLCLAVPGLMLAENYPDHDRSGRTSARDFARNILESLPPDAILFTNGDNYTFPLWYAQETEGIRPDISVINMAYLSVPRYAAMLGVPSAGGTAVPMTATADDLVYGAHLVTSVKGEPQDTLDAMTALRNLYASRESVPAITAGVLTIPAPDGTKVAVDVRKLANGSSSLKFTRLMLLDIIATNASRGWKRPVCFIAGLSEGDLGPFRGNTVRETYALRLRDTGRIGERDSLAAGNIYEFFTRRALWGGMDTPGVYADIVTRQQASLMRGLMIRVARTLFDRGETEKSLQLTMLARKAILPENVPYTVSAAGFTDYNEAVALGSLYIDLADTLRRDDLRKEGLRILGDEMRRSALFVKYRNSLSPRLRGTLSNDSRNRASTFFATVRAYLRGGGTLAEIARMPELQGLNLGGENKAFARRTALFGILRDARRITEMSKMMADEYARQPLSDRRRDSLVWNHYINYLRYGGDMETLQSYKEFDGFDLQRAERLNKERNHAAH